jgi:hypothetical protein
VELAAKEKTEGLVMIIQQLDVKLLKLTNCM